jgi:PDZ domain
MTKLFTLFFCTTACTNAFAQPSNTPSNAVAKITLVERTTDANGKTTEQTVEKTGKDAEAYLQAHPEVQNAKHGEMITKKMTVTRKSIDPLTGQLKVERVVKEGAEARAIDLQKLYLDGGNSLQNSFFDNSIATVGAQNIKVEKKQLTSKTGANEDASEDVDVLIDQTSDAENRAYLGVAAADLPSPKGVVIDFVLEDSPAEAGGLQEWDIINAVQGVPVRNALELQKALAPFGPKDKVQINYYRKDKLEQTTIVLAASEVLGRNAPTKPATAAKTVAAPDVPMAKPVQDMSMPFKDFKLYPNPSGSGIFTMQCTLEPTDYLLIKVIDPVRNSELLTRIVNKQTGEFVHQMDLQREKPGKFILSITHNGTTYTKILEYTK